MAAVTVAVLFTDLVDSTALLSRVGEERAEELRREQFGLVRNAIAASGGTEVKNLGDGLMVVMPGAAVTVVAAVAIQQAFDARNRTATEPLLVRVGVSLGDADVEDGDYFGVPVVQAARLCAKASGGEILVTDVVRALAGTRGSFEFEDFGDLELKGLDAPVSASRVRWAPAEVKEERAPLPTRLASAVSPNFVGRQAEYERLGTTWKAVGSASERRAVLLSGEPGIGKTTLCARFAKDVHDTGATVVYGRCDEDLGIPYQPWVEALTQLVAVVSAGTLGDHLAEGGASLARLVPDLGRGTAIEAAPASDADAERYVLFDCVADIIGRATAERPTMLVLDDLQWADRPSVQLLRYVMTVDRSMRLMVLGTFRDSDVTAENPLTELLAASHREGAVDRLTLRGFSDADLLALLERLAGHAMDDDGIALRDAVLAETEGNPFFVGEILRHLAETGGIFRNETGRWVARVDLRAAGLPVSVREVIGRRLKGLGPNAERVLSLGSVIGRDFDIALLAAISNSDEDALLDLCDAAVAATVLQTTENPNRYTFAHALIERTLYEGLSPARRSRAHRAVAAQLEREHGADPGERAGELAHHWAAAVQPTDVAKAVHSASVAGARALNQLAPDEGMRWYAQALELLDRSAEPDARQRAEILVGLGEAQLQCGIAAHRDTFLEAARIADEIGAIDLLVRAALANSRGFASFIGATDQDRVAVIDRALERLGDADSAARARLLALASVERTFSGDLDERLALAELAVAVAERCGDPVARFDAIRLTSVGLRVPSTLGLRLEQGREECDLADRLKDPVRRYWAHRNAYLNAVEAADHAAAEAHFALMEEAAHRAPHATIRWNMAFEETFRALLLGQLEEAERLAEAALAIGNETGQPDPTGFYAVQLTNLRYHQGRLGELIPLIEQALTDTPGLPAYRAVLALAHIQVGDDTRAALLLGEHRETAFAMRVDSSWSTSIACWAEAAIRIRDTDSASLLLDALMPFPDQLVSSGITIQLSVSHWLGRLAHILGHLDDAETWLNSAMALHERMRSPMLVAYTQAAMADFLADRSLGDDHERARSLVTSALATASAGGYGMIAADARALLDRLR